MLVKKVMTAPVITIHADTPMHEALNLMQQHHIRRLPVVDAKDHLIGIVTEKDLLHASPSDATSLSVWELNYLLSKITVKEIMKSQVFTVSLDTPVEDAAQMMIENKVSGLPVVREGKVIGMVTETDLFKAFMEFLGARERGVRIVAVVPNIPGRLAQLAKAIFDIGGNIIALVTVPDNDSGKYELTIKVQNVEAKSLSNAVEPYVEKILDLRSSS